MSLPSGYSNADEYLKSLLGFLREYKWLYNYPNTHILAYNILDKFPEDWRLYFKETPLHELNNLTLGSYLETCPESLCDFLKKIKDLKPTEIDNIQFNKLHIQQPSVGAKKAHEIALFAPIIEKVCKKNNVDVVIDVGSGRGYLTQKLNELYDFKVIGLEGCDEKVNLSRIYQDKYYPHSKDNVKYEQHFITADSEKVIEEMVRKHFGKDDDSIKGKNVAIVGLHACADLGVDVMDIFSQLSIAKVLLLMPCCYHRLKTSEGEVCNFPKSDSLRSLSKDMNMCEVLGIPFLRLCAQERAGVFALKSVQQHETHARLCSYRAVLQLVVENSNYTISRLKRKSGKCQPSGDAISFDNYLDNLPNTHLISSVVGESPNNSLDEVSSILNTRITTDINLTGNVDENIAASYLFKQEMLAAWATYKDRIYLVEVLACFQAVIQSLCENLVLLDRVLYLQERGLECWVEQVTDDVKSPRCHALIAVKRRCGEEG